MDQPTEADPDAPRSQARPGAQSSGRDSPAAAATRPTLRDQVAQNPLASFLGAVVVALLVSMLTTTNIRINRLEDRVEAGFAAVDDKFERVDDKFERLEARLDDKFERIDAKFERIDDKFERVDAKFERVDARLDEIDLKLTALIAKLDATEDVEAAVEGRLTERASDPADEQRQG